MYAGRADAKVVMGTEQQSTRGAAFLINNLLSQEERPRATTDVVADGPRPAQPCDVVVADGKGEAESVHDDSYNVNDSSPRPCSSRGLEQAKEDETDSIDSSACESADSEKKEKKKKTRTCFSTYQLLELEKAFQSTRYLKACDRYHLATQLDLTEQTIKTWFQNRRMKAKRSAHHSNNIGSTPVTPLPSMHHVGVTMGTSSSAFGPVLATVPGVSQPPMPMDVLQPVAMPAVPYAVANDFSLVSQPVKLYAQPVNVLPQPWPLAGSWNSNSSYAWHPGMNGTLPWMANHSVDLRYDNLRNWHTSRNFALGPHNSQENNGAKFLREKTDEETSS